MTSQENGVAMAPSDWPKRSAARAKYDGSVRIEERFCFLNGE
jgi:hypothetical protein